MNRGFLSLPVNNIEIFKHDKNPDPVAIINERSKEAGLTIVGLNEDELKLEKNIFERFNIIGDLLFVDAKDLKENY